MAAEESKLRRFETRVRQLILAYTALKERNADLNHALYEKDLEVERLKSKILQMESEYKSLQMARTIGGDSTEIATTKAQLSKMIKDINKCIDLLVSSQ